MSTHQKHPIVSVVVLAYNHGPFIKQALDSVLHQETNFPYEILIGEDESTDDTRKTCQEIADSHPQKVRLFLRSREDVIYINGRATGRFNYVETLKASKAKYIAYLDGDDKWVSRHKLQKQVDLLENHPEHSMCFHPVFREFEENPQKNDIFYPPSRKGPYELSHLLVKNIIQSCSVMYRNGLVQRIPDYIYQTTVADWPCHIWHALFGTIGYIDEPMGFYRVHLKGGGQPFRQPKSSALSAIDVLKKVTPYIPRSHRSTLLQTITKHYMDLLNIACLQETGRKQCLQFLEESNSYIRWLDLSNRRYWLRFWLEIHYPKITNTLFFLRRSFWAKIGKIK